MMVFRESVGYATATYRFSLPPFIKNCGEKYPDTTMISKEIVDSWLEKNDFRKINTQAIFISMLRQYTKFIKAQGREAFELGEDYILKREKYLRS